MDRRMAILQALASVAWADGIVQRVESAAIEYLASVFKLSGDEKTQLQGFLAEPVPLTDLNALLPDYKDRIDLYRKACLLTYIDGEQVERERDVLAELAKMFSLEETDVKFAEDEARRVFRLRAQAGAASEG